MVASNHRKDEAEKVCSSNTKPIPQRSHEQCVDFKVESSQVESLENATTPTTGTSKDRATDSLQHLSAHRRDRDNPTMILRENERRPEKTTAVAARLIAAGLGQRAQRRTQEERDYDRAVRALATKRRDQTRKEEMEAEEKAKKAKKAMWED